MPFVSQAQRGFLYANHPSIAKEFEAHTTNKPLPAHVAKLGKPRTPIKPNKNVNYDGTERPVKEAPPAKKTNKGDKVGDKTKVKTQPKH